MKYLEKEYVIYLLQHSFHKWDINILDYLCRLKKFRQNINKSRNPDEAEILPLDTNLPIFEYELISYIRDKRAKSNMMEFYLSDNENKTKYLQFKSYSFVVHLNMMEKNNRFQYNFNYNHMLTLEKIRKLTDLQDYLSKIMIINYKKEIVMLDTKYFDKVEDKSLKFLVDINKDRTIDKHISPKVT
jgi:hypothetical protein